MRTLKNYFSTYLILVCLLILPLYVDNAYFNIVEAKFTAFAWVFALHILPIAILGIIDIVKSIKAKKIQPDIIDIGVLCFCAVSMISCFLSGNIRHSFWGTDGWYIGAFMILAISVWYFWFSRNYSYNHNIWLPVYAVNIIIFIIAIIQFGGNDILNFTEGILAKQYYQYTSTLGNTNWISGYLCMLLPVALVFFLSSRSKLSFGINLIFLVFGFFTMLIIISDGVYIGLGFCAVFAVPCIFRTMTHLKRTLLLVFVYAVEVILVNILPCYNELMSKAIGISGLVLDIRVGIAALIFSALSLILLSRVKGEMVKVRKILCVICQSAIALGIVGMIVYTALTFTDSWGSHRGMIWRVSFERFGEFGIKNKLIGIGPELLREQYLVVQKRFENLAVLSSHSEPIQILLTTGILGLASWLTVIFGSVYKYFKWKRTNAQSEDLRPTAFILALAGYLGQSFINSATTLNLVLVCILFSFFVNSLREKEIY